MFAKLVYYWHMFENFFSFAKKDEKKAESAENSANALKSEHLNKGVRPIIACIGTIGDFDDDPGLVGKIYRPDGDDAIQNVNYWGGHKDLVKKNFKNAEDLSYVISPIDDKDKISKAFRNCTGVAISGTDKETGKNISFLSHQDPGYFLPSKFLPIHPHSDRFAKDIGQQIAALKDRCIPGTIDAVIFGGNYATEEDEPWNKNQSNKEFREKHIRSIDLLASEISEILGFEPVVITGPKTNLYDGSEDDVYYDNKNRRLYIVRPNVGNSAAESYLPKDIKKQEEKWAKDFLDDQK
jgi:hypothetical protein